MLRARFTLGIVVHPIPTGQSPGCLVAGSVDLAARFVNTFNDITQFTPIVIKSSDVIIQLEPDYPFPLRNRSPRFNLSL